MSDIKSSYEKLRLYDIVFSSLLSKELNLRRFAQITDQARFLLDDSDGRLLEIGNQLSSLLEETIDDPDLLLELNTELADKGDSKYISLEMAMPKLLKCHSEIKELLEAQRIKLDL